MKTQSLSGWDKVSIEVKNKFTEEMIQWAINHGAIEGRDYTIVPASEDTPKGVGWEWDFLVNNKLTEEFTEKYNTLTSQLENSNNQNK